MFLFGFSFQFILLCSAVVAANKGRKRKVFNSQPAGLLFFFIIIICCCSGFFLYYVVVDG